jgi:hypothetical protein
LTNIAYLDAAQDSVGANKFWAYGTQTNLNVYDWFIMQRRLHNQGDIDEGVLPMVQAPIIGQSSPFARDGNQYLDNTRNGWPAWNYGITLTTVTANAGINPRIEPFTVYVNPVGLQPVTG